MSSAYEYPQQDADQAAAYLRDHGMTRRELHAAVVVLEAFRATIADNLPAHMAVPVSALLEVLDSSIEAHRKIRDQL